MLANGSLEFATPVADRSKRPHSDGMDWSRYTIGINETAGTIEHGVIRRASAVFVLPHGDRRTHSRRITAALSNFGEARSSKGHGLVPNVRHVAARWTPELALPAYLSGRLDEFQGGKTILFRRRAQAWLLLSATLVAIASMRSSVWSSSHSENALTMAASIVAGTE